MNSGVSRLLIILIVGVGVAWTAFDVERRESSLPPAADDNAPDTYMVNARIKQFGADGSLRHVIQANRFTHYPVTDVTTLVAPVVDLHEVGNTPWHLTSKQGRILPAPDADTGETIELEGEVHAVRAAQGAPVSINTEALFVHPGDNYVETDRSVVIEDQRGRTTAAGMQAWLDPGRYVLHGQGSQRVVSRLTPAREDSAGAR